MQVVTTHYLILTTLSTHLFIFSFNSASASILLSSTDNKHNESCQQSAQCPRGQMLCMVLFIKNKISF